VRGGGGAALIVSPDILGAGLTFEGVRGQGFGELGEI